MNKKFKQGDFIEVKERNRYGTKFCRKVVLDRFGDNILKWINYITLEGVGISFSDENHGMEIISVKRIKPTENEKKQIKLIRRDLKDGTYNYIG